jgi:hypothetical protein
LIGLGPKATALIIFQSFALDKWVIFLRKRDLADLIAIFILFLRWMNFGEGPHLL